MQYLYFYIACGGIIAILMVRMLLRARSGSQTNSSVVPPVSSTASMASAAPAQPATSSPDQPARTTMVVETTTPMSLSQSAQYSILKSDSALAEDLAAKGTAAAADTSWRVDAAAQPIHKSKPLEAPLFDVLGRRAAASSDALPTIEAASTPLADGSDLVFGPATSALAEMLPVTDQRKSDIARELQNAGYFQPNALTNFSAIRYAAVMIPLLAFGAILLFVPPQMERGVLIGLVAVPFLGWALPRLYVRQQARKRLNEIERALPDMLDMLNMCVSQGMTVPNSLKRVSDELEDVHPALHQELKIVTEQARIGTLRHALENFSRRCDLSEVHSFTSLITQTDRMGTNVSTALSEYSDNMRESLKQRSDEKGNQAAFKLLFPTVTCLMPAVYLFLLGPSIVELTKFFSREDSSLRQASEIIRNTGATPNQPIRGGTR